MDAEPVGGLYFFKANLGIRYYKLYNFSVTLRHKQKVMDNLNTYLRTEFMKHGICHKFLDDWNESFSAQELIHRYKAGLDFCIQHNIPSNEFIKGAFDGDTLVDNGVFVDAKGQYFPDSDTLVVQGNSEVTIVSDKFDVHTIHLRHNAVLNLHTKDNSDVHVFVYDNAVLNVVRGDNAKVFIRKKSEDCNIFAEDSAYIKIR